jgi:calcineurin-like phosphoesterase family protein
MRALRPAVLLALLLAAATARAQNVTLPNKETSVRFAVIGDTGRGDRGQNETAQMLEAVHAKFPFPFVIMVGDNMYGADTPGDYVNKFENPYKPLIAKGVKFYAALGNHDNPNQRFYKQFNMNGERFYTFRGSAGGLAKLTEGGVRFFAIDSNYLDKSQLDWLSKELAASGSDWKIAFFHHPLYSSGKTHGSALETRAVLEPLFVKDHVSVVFTGHDHFYERIKPQKGGILHFVVGAGGSLRKGDIRRTDMTDKGFDTDYSFLIAEIDGDQMYFQAISRKGETVDSGVFKRPDAGTGAVAAGKPAAAEAEVPAAVASPSVETVKELKADVAKEQKAEAAAASPTPSPGVAPSPSPSPSPSAATKAKSKTRKKKTANKP